MRNSKDVLKIFKLKGYIVDRIEECCSNIHIYCHIKKHGMWLNKQYSSRIAEIKTRKVSHMMLENKQVVLVVTQRRFVFESTKRWEKLPGVEQYKQTTNTFRLHTLRELQRDNYSGSGHKRHRSGMFPMKLLDGLKTEFKWRKGIKRVGLDGKYVCKHKLVHHLADVDEGKSITILPNLNQKDFKKNS